MAILPDWAPVSSVIGGVRRSAGLKIGAVKRLVMTGPDENSFNEPGKPPAVTIREEAVPEWKGSLTLDKLSLTILLLTQE